MKMTKLNILLLAAAVVTMISVVQTHAATYSQNFDSLSSGTDIYTVAGWGEGFFGGPMSGRTVSTAQAQSAPHSLFMRSTSPDSSVNLDLTNASVLGAAIGSGIWNVEFDLYPTLLTGGLEIQTSSSAGAFNALWSPPLNLLPLTGMIEAQWNNVVLELDFDSDVLTVKVNAVDVATRALDAGESLATFALAPYTNAADLYLDNVSIAAVPEPASLALLGLAGLLVLTPARRRRS